MTKFFGTDGIRGKANQVLTPELALLLGKAAARTLAEQKPGQVVLIGKDTRLSGDMLEAALAAGIASMGLDVFLLGVIPTPGVAMLCRMYDGPGVVISASHNPFYDNGIKFFSIQGLKLSDAQEEQMEALLEDPAQLAVGDENIGRIRLLPNAVDDYRALLLQAQNPDLSGMKIGLDCANGAASPFAKELFRSLGAQVVAINERPDGVNINLNCGSTHPEQLQQLVQEQGLTLGLAFDGDADRLLAVDGSGALIDGDLLLAIMARQLHQQGKLAQNALVMTVVSNLGLRLRLEELGIAVSESSVGDRYVLEKMRETGANLGGEQSGHLILQDYNSTGDAMAAALCLLSIIKATGQDLRQLAADWPRFPQVQQSVTVKSKDGWRENLAIAQAIFTAETALQGRGRVLVRPSGTEPKFRVLTEGPDAAELEQHTQAIAAAIEQELG